MNTLKYMLSIVLLGALLAGCDNDNNNNNRNVRNNSVDDYVRVTDKESMIMTRRLAREEGLFVGQSCGMAWSGFYHSVVSSFSPLSALKIRTCTQIPQSNADSES